MNTYEIDFWHNFEGFSKAKIAFEGVGRERKGNKMRSELSFSIASSIFGPCPDRHFMGFGWGGAVGGGVRGGGLGF